MMNSGVLLALLSGLCNGLFTAPMKLRSPWKWENTWLVFIIVACLAMPICIVLPVASNLPEVLTSSPRNAVVAALGFGFAWGFGAISFGQSVHSLGVSIANSLVIGISSAFGSLVPLVMGGDFHFTPRVLMLLAGVTAFLIGVAFCGSAGILRDRVAAEENRAQVQMKGYVFAVAAGVMSAIFNIGFALALPIAMTGKAMGYSEFTATNCIWLLMLGAGSVPNIAYCLFLMSKNKTGSLTFGNHAARGWTLATAMGLLWGGSIFLYGAAVPKLGDIGPSIGWPLSLAAGLLVANAMGLLLGEWRSAPAQARSRMRYGLVVLVVAIVLCASSTRMTT